MTSAVREMQKAALDRSSSVTELVQRCYVIARKLGSEDICIWAKRELEGYGEDEVPPYRIVHGNPRVFNPYRGYQPLQFEDPKEYERFSTVHFNQSIGEIEHTYGGAEKKPGSNFIVFYNPKVEALLTKAIEFSLRPSLHVPASELRRILEAVRAAVLEWSLKLEEDGILGEDLEFSTKEQQKASSVIYNVKNYVHGNLDRAQIQIESDGSSQVVEKRGLDLPGVGEFIATVLGELEALRLPCAVKDELIAEISTLRSQVDSPKPKEGIIVEALGSIRRILEAASGNLVASGLLPQVTRLLGA